MPSSEKDGILSGAGTVSPLTWLFRFCCKSATRSRLDNCCASKRTQPGIVNLMGTCTLLCHNLKMKAQKELPTYKRYRYPIEIIRHCIWLYYRFSLSYRDVELLMTERGIIVSYESIRQWCLKFGDEYALGLPKE